jgi:hypothetical protein
VPDSVDTPTPAPPAAAPPPVPAAPDAPAFITVTVRPFVAATFVICCAFIGIAAAIG